MIPLPLADTVTECGNSCGKCCETIGTPPGYSAFFPWGGHPIADWAKEGDDYQRFLTMPEALRRGLADYYRSVERGEVKDRSAYDVPCLWYDAERHACGHHSERPDVCREFEIGGEDCLRFRLEGGVG